MARENQSWMKHEIKELTFFIIFGIIMAILLPIFLGFVLEGFSESFVTEKPLEFGSFLVTFIVYYIMILAGLIGLPVLKIREMFITARGEHPARQKNPSMFSVSYLHDPEIDGGIYNLFRFLGFRGKKNPMRWSLSMFRMFIIGTLVFGTLGLLQTVNPNAQFVGIPQLPFQVTETVEVLFTAEPPAFAETTMVLFVLSLLMGVNAWFCSKFKLPMGIYWFIAIMFICPIIGAGWMGFHNIVYGSSETALLATFVFGWFGATITILFGTWILWYTWHFWNNIFAKLRDVVPAHEDIIAISIACLVLLLILWIIGELLLRKYRKKDPHQSVVIPT